jgi:thymidylate synthase ThyX
MNEIKADIILDSINTSGNRLTTFVLTFPRIILAEFNTHRVLSRSSASSRAIPFGKMVERVENDPFIPIRWMKDHKGMQGTEFFTDEEAKPLIVNHLRARDEAVARAKVAAYAKVTKQICNRYLEPFMWHTAIVTGSEFENFFALRADPQAEIHMEALADKMLASYNKSVPRLLRKGEWHIPFGDKMDEDKLIEFAWFFLSANKGHESEPTADEIFEYINDKLKIQIATARCARVSYLNFEGKEDYKADKLLHDRLIQSGHWSPFEHCARADNQPNRYGNFIGWQQYRKMFPQENKTDKRVVKNRILN